MRRLLSLLAALMLLVIGTLPANASAYGRVQVGPSSIRTYKAATAFFTPAASTTDILTIAYGSKKTTILKIEYAFNGTFGTPISQAGFIIKRSTADSGGTATTETNISCNSTDAASTAVIKSYTANPSSLGTSVGRVKSFSHAGDTYVNGSGGFQIFPSRVIYDAQTAEGPLKLVASGENYAVNFNGVTMGGTPVAFTVTWTEED